MSKPNAKSFATEEDCECCDATLECPFYWMTANLTCDDNGRNYCTSLGGTLVNQTDCDEQDYGGGLACKLPFGTNPPEEDGWAQIRGSCCDGECFSSPCP